ncbi:hypothetical protein [Brevibacillus porteri]|uniref:hypothetical protein n=1 Tax=Brevibacillus porteri TaxID=2126350 RepID=UPI00364491DD
MDQNKLKYIELRLEFEKKMLLELMPEDHKEDLNGMPIFLEVVSTVCITIRNQRTMISSLPQKA